MSQLVNDAVVSETRVEAQEDQRASRAQRWVSALGWPAAVVLTVVVVAAIPALFMHRFYFYGDTQAGAVGQWYHLGEQLRDGSWPLLDLSAWRAGNFAAEGQWGLFSPLTLAVALASTVAPNLVVFVTVLKTGLLVLGALGMFVLLRGYGTTRAAAYLGAVGITIGGATQYLESPSWVTGQMCWALLPWAWWGHRRLIRDGTNPAPALVAGFLIVTVGYVYGTMFLILVVLACLLEAVLERRWGGFLRVTCAGALSGLVAVTVYLPGVLTASVTTRSGWEVLSTGRLQADLPGVMTSMLPTAISPAATYAPVHYVAWFLPMLMWVDLGKVRALVRPMAGAWFMLAAMLAWALGPNQLGPIRWPLRVMPEVTLTAVVVTMVLVSSALVKRPSAKRLALSLLWLLAAAYLVVSRFWPSSLEMVAAATVLVALALGATWWVVRRQGFGLAAAVIGGVVTVLAITLQHYYDPKPASTDRHLSAVRADYPDVASTSRGDMMQIGNPDWLIREVPEATRDQLVGSSWFLTGRPTQSVYSTIGFRTYNERYCFRYQGATCGRALTELFSTEPTTGKPRIDLLSVSTLHFDRGDFRNKRLLNPPDGWSVTDRSRYSVTWVRDEILPRAGGVTWASDGLEVTERSASVREVELEIGSVPSGGGTVVLSRLAWPGYSVEGGTLGDPVDDYLLTVKVPPGGEHRTVTVRYSPPGWALERTTLAIALVLGSLWSLVLLLPRRLVSQARRLLPGNGPSSK